jgi:hypothetical protein
MHSLFTGLRLWTNCEQRKSARQIKVVLVLRQKIIHSFFNPKASAVNKFRLLLLEKSHRQENF